MRYRFQGFWQLATTGYSLITHWKCDRILGKLQSTDTDTLTKAQVYKP
jgi:hypothetical protein